MEIKTRGSESLTFIAGLKLKSKELANKHVTSRKEAGFDDSFMVNMVIIGL